MQRFELRQVTPETPADRDARTLQPSDSEAPRPQAPAWRLTVLALLVLAAFVARDLWTQANVEHLPYSEFQELLADETSTQDRAHAAS